jgi:antitoxin ParD1/3/4
MPKNTRVTLGPLVEKFVGQQVAAGYPGSVSEAVRAGLRLLEEKEAKLNLLRRSLEEVENSGVAEYPLGGFIEGLGAEDLQ